MWLWRASEYCTKVRGTLHSRASLLVLSLLSSLLPVSPLPGSLLHTESRKVDGADDGEGQLAEVDIAPEEMLPEVELARNIWEHDGTILHGFCHMLPAQSAILILTKLT